MRSPSPAIRAARLQCGLAAIVAPVWLLGLSGCVGFFAAGPESLSVGNHARGALLAGVAVPPEGSGYFVHPDWRARNRLYATDEVAQWLTRAFRKVNEVVPDSVAYLGDLSARRGGNSTLHRSHESGRDVDIFYYAVDGEGRPLRNLPAMLRFGPGGAIAGWSPCGHGRRVTAPLPSGRIDLRRNWSLIQALLSDPGVEVQWIFIHEHLASLLLEEAEAEHADPAVVARAREILHQPTDSQSHDDHMHVRVYCDPGSRSFGCVDKGPRRWLKKHWKYMGRESLIGEGTAVATAASESRP